MSIFRCFARSVWKADSEYPDGYAPHAVSMDDCRTLARFEEREEAVAFCDKRNTMWRKYHDRVFNGTATDKQRQVYYEAPRYEFTEVTA